MNKIMEHKVKRPRKQDRQARVRRALEEFKKTPLAEDAKVALEIMRASILARHEQADRAFPLTLRGGYVPLDEPITRR